MARRLHRVRLAIDGLLLVLTLAVVAIVAFTNFAPLAGHRALTIRGGSMAPAIPLGSLVDVAPADPTALRPGDVVNLRFENGTIVTHRIVNVVQERGATYIRTKGDANGDMDPTLVPVTQVIGRVNLIVPAAGYLAYLLTVPQGIAFVLLVAAALLVAAWLLDDLEAVAAGTGGPADAVGTIGRAALSPVLTTAAGVSIGGTGASTLPSPDLSSTIPDRRPPASI